MPSYDPAITGTQVVPDRVYSGAHHQSGLRRRLQRHGHLASAVVGEQQAMTPMGPLVGLGALSGPLYPSSILTPWSECQRTAR